MTESWLRTALAVWGSWVFLTSIYSYVSIAEVWGSSMLPEGIRGGKDDYAELQ